MLEYGLGALALLILVVLLPRTIEFTSQGKRLAAVMPGGLERVGRAELASAVLGIIPVVLVDHANIDIALLEDAVIGQQGLDIVAQLQEWVAPLINIAHQSIRQVLVNPTWAEVGRMHARA